MKSTNVALCASQAITAESPDLLAEKVVNLMDGTAPLHLAARHGHAPAVAALLAAGADPEAEDGHGLTALRVRLLNTCAQPGPITRPAITGRWPKSGNGTW